MLLDGGIHLTRRIKNDSDCANFVSQCLYAGGLSKMTSAWYHISITVPAYKVKRGVKYFYGYKKIYDISDAWGKTPKLLSWLKNSNLTKPGITFTLSNMNKLCRSGIRTGDVAFFYNAKKKKYTHAVLVGTIKYDKMWYWSHTNPRNGTNIYGDDFKSVLRKGTYSKIYILRIK